MTRLALALLLAALAAPARAHDMAKGPNGGPVIDSGGHHVEMVVRAGELVLFLSEENGAPIASAGTRNARAIIQEAGRTATVPLQPSAPNRLVGTLAQPLGKGARVVASAVLPDGHSIQARFVAP